MSYSQNMSNSESPRVLGRGVSSVLDLDGCCVSIPMTFDSGLGLDSGISLPSVRSNNLASIAHDSAMEQQLASNFSLLQVSSESQPNYSQYQNTSLVQSAPVTTPQSSDFFVQNEEGDTILHISIIGGDATQALRLIHMADDPEYLDIQNFIYWQSPLHLAVITDQPDIVRQLVLNGASPWKQDHEGNTPVHLACKNGSMECLRQLTAPLTEEERCCLQMRSESLQRPSYMTQIINQSPDFSIKNYDGETCLHVAQNSTAPNRLNIFMFLILSLAVDVNMEEGKCGYTVLHQAIKSCDMDVIKSLLLQPTIDVNKSCYNGSTPLSLAKSLQLTNVAFMLLARGAVDCAISEESNSDSEDDQIEGFDDLMI